MSITFITYDGSKSSAVKLGFTLVGDPPGPIEKYHTDIMVRWGNSYPSFNRMGNYAEYDRVFNPWRAIRANCMKRDATKMLSEVVKTPRLFERSVPRGVLAVVRPWEHIAGKGFCIKEGPFTLDYGTYAVEFIDVAKAPDMEVRVWFCGKHTMIGKRARSANKEGRPCRSEWGYEFNTCGVTGRRHYFDPVLGTDTIKAAKKIGLDAGAADVLWKDGHAVFLELNSAPSIDHHRIVSFFQQYLPMAAKEKFGLKQ